MTTDIDITKYNKTLGDKICKLLANGATLRQVCDDDDSMPGEATVRAWALDHEHPFSAQYVRARELGYLKMADDLMHIADDGTNDFMTKIGRNGDEIEVVNHENINRSRLRVDTRKWLLSKALPKVFGDKISAEVTGKDGKDLIPESASLDELSKAVFAAMQAETLKENEE